MLSLLRRLRDAFHRPVLNALNAELRRGTAILSESHRQQMLATARGSEPKRLLSAGFKVFSQWDDDGILEEIFRRIGPGTRAFVEFGASDGVENNTRYLLGQGWSGVWIEASESSVAQIQRREGDAVASQRLKVVLSFVTAENIESLFQSAGVPAEPDLLSIDIDGNDYWVWKAIQRYKPRVVVTEFNATFGPRGEYVMPYDPNHAWDQTSRFGASLKSFEKLGEQKGYALVACDFAGVNAFFVRRDLVEDKFLAPFTSENHWEPPRYYLEMISGHPHRWYPATPQG